jgi:hypothetical protein
MWIDNYDDPEETSLEEALLLLKQNDFKDCTEEANKTFLDGQKQFRVFEDPSGTGVHFCQEEQDVIDLVIGQALEYQEKMEG